MKRSKAFTLIEFLLAMTLSSLLLIYFFYVLKTHFNLWQRASVEMGALQEATFVLNQITRNISGAARINPSSNGKNLNLDFESESLAYDYFKNMVRRRKNLNSTSYLTDENIIQSLTFEYPSSRHVAVTVGIYGRAKSRVWLITAEAGVRL